MDKICQSCGMPITSNEQLGTEKDGKINNYYCKYCYEKGGKLNDWYWQTMICTYGGVCYE